MMDIYGQIREKIQSIAGTRLRQPVVFPALVERVNGSTCSVKIDELTITDVRLRAVINNNAGQLLVTPRVGSYVLVVDLSGGDYRDLAVISHSEIMEVKVRIGDTVAIIDADGVTFNGGALGGLVKLQELKDNLDSLKQFTEAIHSALPGAFSAIGASTAANGALGATNYQGAMAGKTVQLKDMENEKIKQ